MKIAIYIQAHSNPEQLARLCERLKHESVDIYVHIDLKCDINPFRKLISQVTFVDNRIDVRWGGFSQIEATLNSLKQIQASTTEYDYVLFISGQDYPIVSINRIVDQIEHNRGKGYIFGRPLTDSGEDQSTHRRYRNYYFSFSNRLVSLAVNRLIRLSQLVKRKYPFPIVYKGSQWWCLTGRCVDYILDFCANNHDFVHFHRHTHGCDEFFFQNIVANSSFAEAELREEKDHHVYMDWSQHKSNPKTFTTMDYEKIISSDKWFARKLDIESDPQLFDMIDRYAEQTS